MIVPVRRVALLLAVATLIPALAGCATPSVPTSGDAESLAVTAKRASAWVDTPREARAAGYAPVPYCQPGEGVHWIHQAAVDTHIDPLHPEVLLFAPTTENLTDDDHQRFVGVEYVAVTEGTEQNSSQDPPTIRGVPMEGPFPGGGPGEPWHAVLHVFLDGDGARSGIHDAAPAAVRCPEGSLPPGAPAPVPASDGDGLLDAHTLPGCSALTGESTHDHPEVVIYLGNATPVDLSPERYQLAAREIHVERGERDANGAVVHVHEEGATLGCFLETLGWRASETQVVLDTGEVFVENETHRFEVLVDGEPASAGLDVEIEHERRYVLRYADTTRPSSL